MVDERPKSGRNAANSQAKITSPSPDIPLSFLPFWHSRDGFNGNIEGVFDEIRIPGIMRIRDCIVPSLALQ